MSLLLLMKIMQEKHIFFQSFLCALKSTSIAEQNVNVAIRSY